MQVFLTSPFIAVRFAISQNSGTGSLLYGDYRVIGSPRKVRVGRQVEGLVHCEKEGLGFMELFLGTAD